MTMKELKERAILVKDKMDVFWPQLGQTTCIDLSILEIEANKLMYSYNNSVVAFVDEKGRLFVIPDFKGVQKLLREEGYAKGYFYVPFSNWDYPLEMKREWKALWAEKNKK